MTQRALTTALALTVVGFIAMSANADYVSSFTPTYSYEGDESPEDAGWNVANVDASATVSGGTLTIDPQSGSYSMTAGTTTTAEWDASAGDVVVEIRYRFSGDSYVTEIRPSDGVDRLRCQLLNDQPEPNTGRLKEATANYYGTTFDPTEFITEQFVIRPGGADLWEVYVDGVIYEKTDGTDWIFTSSQLGNTSANEFLVSSNSSGGTRTGTLEIDYIRWGTVPEPATMGLLALGGGGLLLRRRRSHC